MVASIILTQPIHKIATVDFIQLCHVGFFVYGQFFVLAFVFTVSYVKYIIIFFCCFPAAFDECSVSE